MMAGLLYGLSATDPASFATAASGALLGGWRCGCDRAGRASGIRQSGRRVTRGVREASALSRRAHARMEGAFCSYCIRARRRRSCRPTNVRTPVPSSAMLAGSGTGEVVVAVKVEFTRTAVIVPETTEARAERGVRPNERRIRDRSDRSCEGVRHEGTVKRVEDRPGNTREIPKAGRRGSLVYKHFDVVCENGGPHSRNRQVDSVGAGDISEEAVSASDA